MNITMLYASFILLKKGQIPYCASYFYRGKSHIYTPPDFEENYITKDRDMLLAHEKQHIKQHDPLLYRFLQFIKCFFWISPVVHKAVGFIRQDRELLCDERVTANCSKRDYGRLLLNEAKKAAINPSMAGIVSEPGGIYERVAACVNPFSNSKVSAIIVTSIAFAMFFAGSVGFVKPIVIAPMSVTVYKEGDTAFAHIEGMEEYVLFKPEGLELDEEGLYNYAVSLGLKPEQRVHVVVHEAYRPFIVGGMSVSNGSGFAISELRDMEVFIPSIETQSKLLSIILNYV